MKARRWKMKSEEYMNRKQQEAEMAEVSILIIIIITGHHSKRVTTERRTGSDTPILCFLSPLSIRKHPDPPRVTITMLPS